MKIESTDAQTLHWIILENVAKGTNICTDEHRSYIGLKNKRYEHATIHHSAGEYVKGMASTNSIESFWALLRRGYYGVYHKMSVKYLQKYIDEFSNRNNVRQLDTMEQINTTIAGLVGKRLKYKELIS